MGLPRHERRAVMKNLYEYVHMHVSKSERDDLEALMRRNYPGLMKQMDNLSQTASPVKLDSVYASNYAHNAMTDLKFRPLEDRMADAMDVQMSALRAYVMLLRDTNDKTKLAEIEKRYKSLAEKQQSGHVLPPLEPDQQSK